MNKKKIHYLGSMIHHGGEIKDNVVHRINSIWLLEYFVIVQYLCNWRKI